MNENIFCLLTNICHRWAWMFPFRCLNIPLVVLFSHIMQRGERGCFSLCVFILFVLNLCCELLCCSLCFFTSVLRRTVTLLTQLAKGMASHAALETQVNDATEAAKKYMSENERLQEVSLNFFSYFLIQQVVSTKYSGVVYY